jgi:hypothetical protein
MPLILVIVADPHEAAQLATLIQSRLSVDLVQAAEVGEGLLALEDRIPDLILTSPLMSPFDDGVLDEYLRDLGPAGAHVQTLRIPVLSQAPKKTKRLGFSLRRSKPEAPTTTGCDPKVFADEIEQYLARAVEEKRHVESSDQPVVIERHTPIAAAEVAEEQWTAGYSENEPETVGWRADLLDEPRADEETPIYQPSTAGYDAIPVAYEEPALAIEEPETTHDELHVAYEGLTPEEEQGASSPSEPIVTAYQQDDSAHEQVQEIVTAWEEDAASDPVVEAIAESTIEPEAVLAETDEPEAPSLVEEPVAVVTKSPAAPAFDDDKASPTFKAALAAIRAAWGKSPRKTDSPISVPAPPTHASSQPAVAPAETVASIEVDLTSSVEVLDEERLDVEAPAATATHAPVDRVDDGTDVYELSVEPGMDDLASTLVAPIAHQQRTPAPAAVVAEPALQEHPTIDSAAPADGDAHGDNRKKGKRAAKSVKARPSRPTPTPAQPAAPQNEWGIFDPNQCGFAALVDKLDEVADKKPDRPQGGAKARVISLS